MKERNYCCVNQFMDDLFNIYDYIGEYESICIYAHADVISELLRELAHTYYEDEPFELGIINFDGGVYDYGKEYLLSINDDKTIWVEPCWHEDAIIYGEGFVNFVHADCNSKILLKLEDWEQKVVAFDYDGSCDYT